jgi:hypothetical protein
MSNSNFNEFFGPTLHWAQNQIYGTNEDGEQNIFSFAGTISNAPYEWVPYNGVRYTAVILNDLTFGISHQSSDGKFTVRDGFELAGGILGGLAGVGFGGVFGLWEWDLW